MKLSVDLSSAIYVLRGDDDVLLADTVRELVHALVGSGDRTLMVEELDGPRYENDNGDYHIGPLVDAAQTPPFLTDRRIVVGRQAGIFSTNDTVAPLVEYLADPLDSTSLVLVWEKSPRTGAKFSNRLPTKLVDAVKKAGGVVVDTGAGAGKARSEWLDDALKNAPVKLDASARTLIEERIGDDAGLLVGLLATLEGAFGPGAKVSAEALSPYLGQEGGAKPWDLTDAIDNGDITRSLDVLQRMLGTGQHPLQIMAALTNHYVRMLTLDGAGVADEKGAAEILGIKGSTFPAKKALAQSRKLGSERLVEFLGLLAQADLDLKGAKAWPAELVAEVLVARLASRTPRGSSRSGGGARGGYAGRR